MKTVKIAGGGGPVEFTVTIGGAHFGRYRLTLWGAGGRAVPLGEGNNVDGVPDVFYRAPQDCAGTILGVEINVAAYGEVPGQNYSARIDIRQQGAAADGSPLSYSGPLDGGAKAIVDHAILDVS
jgi:hypothetical protein